MKIHILYNFQQRPWGGGNQFLKALKEEFINKRIYEEEIYKADVILINSHHNLECCFRIKKKYPDKIVIYRLDGPVSLVRGRDEGIDKTIMIFNKLFVDGIIFQSNWCKEQNKKYFEISSAYETIIHNAPDSKIFNKIGKKAFNPEEKVKLIATSWSSNWRKGFDVYKFLDENLDFSKYEMTFVGNSPVKFKNIKWIKSVPSEKLAEILKQNDIYITASQKDPCSNSLIEALSCGLPAVVLNDGGHPELAQRGGELFIGKEDVIKKIDKVADNYFSYQSRIPKFLIEKVARDYYEFTKKIYEDVKNDQYQLKEIKFSTKVRFYKIKLMTLKWKIFRKLRIIETKICKE